MLPIPLSLLPQPVLVCFAHVKELLPFALTHPIRMGLGHPLFPPLFFFDEVRVVQVDMHHPAVNKQHCRTPADRDEARSIQHRRCGSLRRW